MYTGICSRLKFPPELVCATRTCKDWQRSFKAGADYACNREESFIILNVLNLLFQNF